MEQTLVPIPGVSKSILPGGKQIKNKQIFDDFQGFVSKKSVVRRRPSAFVRRPSSVVVVRRRRPLSVVVGHRLSLTFFSWCDQVVFLGTKEGRSAPIRPPY